MSLVSSDRCYGCYGITDDKRECKASCEKCYYKGKRLYRCHTCQFGEGRSAKCQFRWNGK